MFTSPGGRYLAITEVDGDRCLFEYDASHPDNATILVRESVVRDKVRRNAKNDVFNFLGL